MALPDIQLDPRNERELLEQAAQYAIEKSKGQLGNLSPANPLLFLLEAQVFAGAELLWYLNKLPLKLITQFLGYWGVNSITGTASTGDVMVTLTTTLPNALTLPSGLLFSDGDQIFKSVNPVIVPAGSDTALVPVQCESVGVIGNVPAYSINNVVTPIAFLKSVTNPNQFLTGTDPVSDDDAVSNFVSELRSDQCISEEDYIRISNKFLGVGWDVRIQANTSPTTDRGNIGTVAVLIGNPKNIDTPEATTIALQKHLTTKTPITSRVWVSALKYTPLVIKVYASYSEGEFGDATLIANELNDLIQEQLLVNTQRITDRDLIRLGDRLGISVDSSSINGGHSGTVRGGNYALYLKYLEIQLTPNNSDFVRGDDTRLLWGSESGQLFIFGQGDED
jgi:hypothetical protein